MVKVSWITQKLKKLLMWSSNLDLYAQSAGRKTLHHPCSFSQKSQYLKILIPLSNDVITIYCCISYRLDYRCSLVSGLCSYLWGGGGRGRGVHGSYSQTAADNHAYISNHHFQEDNLLAWHDTLNSLPLWIQFLIHVLCFAGFVLPIRDVRASVGAGFLYPLVGTVCVFFNIFHYISSLQLLFGLVTTCSLGGCVLHDKYKAICSGLYCTLLHLLVVLCPLWSNER